MNSSAKSTRCWKILVDTVHPHCYSLIQVAPDGERWEWRNTPTSGTGGNAQPYEDRRTHIRGNADDVGEVNRVAGELRCDEQLG